MMRLPDSQKSFKIGLAVYKHNTGMCTAAQLIFTFPTAFAVAAVFNKLWNQKLMNSSALIAVAETLSLKLGHSDVIILTSWC